MKRRLAAVLAADVAGYSRMMSLDEVATHNALKGHRRELLDPAVRDHGGRIVKLTGDGLLAEFPSAVAAVEFAVAVQRGMRERNMGIAEDRRIQIRIGINLCEIIVDDEDQDIYGDGVNIAARLEALAEPGEICISGTVHENIVGRVKAPFEDTGERHVKNIPRPIRVWRSLINPETARVSAVHASEERMAFPLPQRPSIAVLPFDRLSADPSDEFLADGLAEDVITALSKVPNLFVIARNSSFVYKGRPTKVQQVAEDLGVRCVLQGSLQRAGPRLRISAQLIDALSGHHIWADRFDRDASDVFSMQDEITASVAEALEVSLTEGEQARIRRRRTENLQAYGLFREGIEKFRRLNRADNETARTLAQRALDIDPSLTGAYPLQGLTYSVAVHFGWSSDKAADLERAHRLALKALEIDRDDADAYGLLATVCLYAGRHAEAIEFGEKAITLEPSHADATLILAWVLNYAEQPGRGLEMIERAMRLSPYYNPGYSGVLGLAHHLLNHSGRALAAFESWYQRDPGSPIPAAWLPALYQQAGRIEDARRAAKRLVALHSTEWVKAYMSSLPFACRSQIERLLGLLRDAGVEV